MPWGRGWLTIKLAQVTCNQVKTSQPNTPPTLITISSLPYLTDTLLCFKSLFKVISTAEIMPATKLASEASHEKTHARAGWGVAGWRCGGSLLSRATRARFFTISSNEEFSHRLNSLLSPSSRWEITECSAKYIYIAD